MDVLKWHYLWKNGKMIKTPVWGITKSTKFKLNK